MLTFLSAFRPPEPGGGSAAPWAGAVFLSPDCAGGRFNRILGRGSLIWLGKDPKPRNADSEDSCLPDTSRSGIPPHKTYSSVSSSSDVGPCLRNGLGA